MWSFDRYRRWMEQKKDWVRPSRPSASPSVEPSVYEAPPPVARPKAKPSQAPVDIAIDENADLAELARKIEKKIR